MDKLYYKGKGEHSVKQLELIIEQLTEELYLLKSGQMQLQQTGVNKRFYCQDNFYDKKEQCEKQCITCFSKE